MAETEAIDDETTVFPSLPLLESRGGVTSVTVGIKATPLKCRCMKYLLRKCEIRLVVDGISLLRNEIFVLWTNVLRLDRNMAPVQRRHILC